MPDSDDLPGKGPRSPVLIVNIPASTPRRHEQVSIDSKNGAVILFPYAELI